MKRETKYFFQIFTLLIVFYSFSLGAEYYGKNIDGIIFDGVAYSYSTGRYYYVWVEFDNEEGNIYFSNGGKITITLDDEEIEDPTSISGYDYKHSVFWELEINDLK